MSNFVNGPNKNALNNYFQYVTLSLELETICSAIVLVGQSLQKTSNLFYYTGWPRKNATPMINNFNKKLCALLRMKFISSKMTPRSLTLMKVF